MLIEIKAYRAKKGSDIAGLKLGTNELAGKLTFTAQNDTDAMQLAAIAWAFVDADNEALQKLRQDSILEFCKKYGMTLTKPVEN